MRNNQKPLIDGRSANGSYRQVVPVRSRLLRGVVAASLAASMTVSVPLAASAGEQDADAGSSDAGAVQAWKDALSASQSPDYAPYSSTASSADDANLSSSESAATYPSSYDLRDPSSDGDTTDSVVTPVKRQSPMNTCWDFAAIAASETSILSDLGTTYNETNIDLSERYVAWFTYSQVPESYSGQAQAGEGLNSDQLAGKSFIFKRGGFSHYATTLFSAGVGPVSESVAPYRNDEGIMVCSVIAPGETKGKEQTLTDDQIAALRDQGYTVEPLYYAASTFEEGKGTTFLTWQLDDSLYGLSEYTLEESYITPELCKHGETGSYQGVNWEGVNAVKAQLLAGRAVATSSYMDPATPSAGTPRYINFETWAQYANVEDAERDRLLHAYTIVGWDDNFSKDNFLSTHDLPEGDGAWLVKNSWGASTNDFPNRGDWGLEDADGNSTGYFWVSYYDQTLGGAEAFDYDVNSETSDEDFDIDQYNFLMASDSTLTNASDEKLSCANEFTADDDRVLRAVACETVKPNTDVTYEVYLLDSDDAQPTDGKLVLTKNAHYDYGGYHRLMLDEADRIAMRAGQRYAVVVTQKCATDGKYYQMASRTDNKNYQRMLSTFEVKVNAGESWTLSDGQWLDWKNVSEEATAGTTYVIDNFPIKGLSQERSFASVDELASLDESLAQAKGVLAAAQVSADGSDVYACDTWMTQAEHDAAAAAVETAEKAIAAAGDYESELAGTTPSSDEVKAAQAALVLEAKQGSKAVPTFPDVDYSEGGWYADSATWCATHGLILGYPDGLFGVGDTMSRAQLATMLWRHFEPEAAAGYDEAMPTTKGTDAVDGVEDAQYYTAAANWAVASGVIDGFEQEGSAKRDFAPCGEVSFEQLVSIVAKASGADYESSDLSVLDRFADKDAVSPWAAHAMAWAVEEGLVSGWDNGADNLRELKPAEPVARERAAVVLANAFSAGVLK